MLCMAAVMAALSSCGNDGTFRINGQIENYGTATCEWCITPTGRCSRWWPAIDGKFSMTGRLDRPTLARIYTVTGPLWGGLQSNR